MADESREARFDWAAILRTTAIIVGITAVFGFAVPAGLTVALRLYNTGRVAGHELYRWAFWAVAWGLTVWQGAVMIRRVHERIVDDMLVASVVCAVLLLIVKFVIALVYVPISSEGALLPLITSIDAVGAVALFVVALIAARINRY
jgi:hypothetical protein